METHFNYADGLDAASLDAKRFLTEFSQLDVCDSVPNGENHHPRVKCSRNSHPIMLSFFNTFSQGDLGGGFSGNPGFVLV